MKKEKVSASENADLKPIILSAIEAVSRDDGWASLSGVGGYINKNVPSFDPRNYGYDKLGKLVKSLDYIAIDRRKSEDGSSIIHIYISAKND